MKHVYKKSQLPVICLCNALIFLFISSLRAEIVCTPTIGQAHAGAQSLPTCANNGWYSYNDNSDTVFVFVHGILSSTQGAFLNENKGVFWPELVVNDQTFHSNQNSPSIFLGGYSSELKSGSYGVTEIVSDLNSSIAQESNKKSVLEHKNIVFVSHSLGGIIIRKLLYDFREQFAEKKIGLLLVASPSGGSKYADYLQNVARHLNFNNHQLRILQTQNLLLKDIETNFKRLTNSNSTIKLAGLSGKEITEDQLISRGSMEANRLNNSITYIVNLFQPIVPNESASRFFNNPVTIDGSSHSSISKPEDLEARSHKVLQAYFENIFLPHTSPACRGNEQSFVYSNFDHKLDNGSIFTYHIPNETGKNTTIINNQIAKFNFFPPFPCPDDQYKMRFFSTRNAGKSNDTHASWNICFNRKTDYKSDDLSAKISCSESGKCKPNETDPGFANPCTTTGFYWNNFNIFSSAFAKESPAYHWVSRSKQTLNLLPKNKRRGFAQFSIKTDALAEFKRANRFSTLVEANGIPVHIDGWDPHTELHELNPEYGIRYTFALENLGYTGNRDGYEAIKVKFVLYEGQEKLGEISTKRPYASFRHFGKPIVKPEKANQSKDNGMEFKWAGEYFPANIEERYEVMLVSRELKSNKPRKGIVGAKASLDGTKIKYDNGDLSGMVTGVIRAPRALEGPRSAYGMAFGVRSENGIVQSAFSLSRAKEICKWVPQNLGKLIKRKQVDKDVYINDFSPELFYGPEKINGVKTITVGC